MLTAAALLASPLGWVYYFWLPIAPLVATVIAAIPSFSRGECVGAGIVVAGAVWHASATLWLQPSGLATLTLGSPDFWALSGVWVWLLRRPPHY